jgi:hypothetical protein
MKVTAELLREKGACSGGIEWFDRLFPQGFEVAEWTPMHQAMTLGDPDGRKHWGWACWVGIIPRHSMAGWRLRGASLRGASLQFAVFWGANLRYADLRGADLRRANLRGANLRGANLGGADLRRANLGDADLRGANLDNWERGPDGFARRREQQ